MRHVEARTEILKRSILLAELSTVLVDVLQAGVDDDALRSELTVEECILRRVERYEEIGHDATAAIDGAMKSQCLVTQRVGEVNAVLGIEFAMLESLLDVFLVVSLLTLHIRLLNATARRGEIVGNGEANHRTVGELDGSLHKAFAKRAAANDLSAVLILQRAGDNLGSRCGIFIDEYDDATAGTKMTVARCAEVLAWHGTSLGVDDDVVLLQELIGNLRCCLQVATTIVLQVENERLKRSLVPQLLQGLHELFVSGGAKRADTDVAHTGLDHVGCVEGVNGNLIACHRERQHVADTAAHHAEPYLRTLLATQALHDIFLRHLHTGDGGIVDANDAITRQDSYLLRRTVQRGLDDKQRVFNHVELHADAFKRTLQGLVHRLGLLSGAIGGMGVELLYHAANGIFDKLVFVDGVNIQIRNRHLRHLQLPNRRVVAEVEMKLSRGGQGEKQQ